jgi:hypothetical protein
MEIDMREIGIKAKNMDLEFISIVMELYMREISIME